MEIPEIKVKVKMSLIDAIKQRIWKKSGGIIIEGDDLVQFFELKPKTSYMLCMPGLTYVQRERLVAMLDDDKKRGKIPSTTEITLVICPGK